MAIVLLSLPSRTVAAENDEPKNVHNNTAAHCCLHPNYFRSLWHLRIMDCEEPLWIIPRSYVLEVPGSSEGVSCDSELSGQKKWKWRNRPDDVSEVRLTLSAQPTVIAMCWLRRDWEKRKQTSNKNKLFSSMLFTSERCTAQHSQLFAYFEHFHFVDIYLQRQSRTISFPFISFYFFARVMATGQPSSASRDGQKRSIIHYCFGLHSDIFVSFHCFSFHAISFSYLSFRTNWFFTLFFRLPSKATIITERFDVGLPPSFFSFFLLCHHR